MIGDEPGEVILSDELRTPTARTETQRTMEKGVRYRTHRESTVSVADRCHCVEVKQKSDLPSFFSLGGDTLMNNGYVNAKMGVNTLSAAPTGRGPHRTKQVVIGVLVERH